MTARAGTSGSDAAKAVVDAFWSVGGVGVVSTAEARTVVVVSADAGLRTRLGERLDGLRWRVREASGGAQAMMLLETQPAEAMLVDNWLPDLEVGEFAAHVRLLYPEVDLLPLHGGIAEDGTGVRSPRRNELLHAIREALDGGSSSPPARLGDGLEQVVESVAARKAEAYRVRPDGSVTDGALDRQGRNGGTINRRKGAAASERPGSSRAMGQDTALPELVGGSEAMRELGRLIRLVAPRSTTVLIEGETGTGKEVVARALHRLSARAGKPFAVLNCAAIPESLLEAELFGHTRGAFTGAVQSRMGRIETANAGTLFLDEIGEMPLALQAKMLRFLESGELQRVGDNEMTRVDVRLIAATHQPLEKRSAEGTFRLDLYHRLAVFPIEAPPLRERLEDIPALAEHFLELMGQEGPRKRLHPEALARLREHAWPGNVRELMHVLERGVILAGVNPEIGVEDIRYRRAQRS
jgi:DNA-binding NtrC family response regulator